MVESGNEFTFLATVDASGRLTIPAEYRQYYGLDKARFLEVEVRPLITPRAPDDFTDLDHFMAYGALLAERLFQGDVELQEEMASRLIRTINQVVKDKSTAAGFTKMLSNLKETFADNDALHDRIESLAEYFLVRFAEKKKHDPEPDPDHKE